jgi:hypothetical protein
MRFASPKKVTIEIEGGRRPAFVAEVIGQHYR